MSRVVEMKPQLWQTPVSTGNCLIFGLYSIKLPILGLPGPLHKLVDGGQLVVKLGVSACKAGDPPRALTPVTLGVTDAGVQWVG